jgi:hypothetical protein
LGAGIWLGKQENIYLFHNPAVKLSIQELKRESSERRGKI